MKTVALVDFAWNGHHPGYFRLFCESLLSAGHRVFALCPQPLEVKGWEDAACYEKRLDAEELTDDIQVHRWKRKIPQLAIRHRFDQCARSVAAWETRSGHRVDLVVFACLYSGVAPFGQLETVFPYRWTGLLLDSGGVRLPNGIKRWLRYRSCDPVGLFRTPGCVSLATLDGFIREDLKRRTGGKPVYVLPEVANGTSLHGFSALAERFRAQASGRAIVGCFGQFARRKGALAFLRLAEACVEEPWFFAWAGQMEERSFSKSEMAWIRSFLASHPTNCRVEFGRADEQDFNSLLSASSVLYLCYCQHPGSSNMIGQAVAFNKPVLVSQGYCMADQTRRHNLGLCVPEGDVAAARVALRRLLAGDEQEVSPPRWEEYRREHSHARFAEVIREMTA